MSPYVRANFPPEDEELLEQIREIVHEIPKLICVGKTSTLPGTDLELTSAILAEAIAKELVAVECVHGLIGNGPTHSWLRTPRGNIIDMLPPGVKSDALLVDMSLGAPWRHMYHTLPERQKRFHYAEMFEDLSFQRAVATVSLKIRTLLKKKEDVGRQLDLLSSPAPAVR